jgi:hypothetical protein
MPLYVMTMLCANILLQEQVWAEQLDRQAKLPMKSSCEATNDAATGAAWLS